MPVPIIALLEDTDFVRIGASYIARYNTGSFDTTGFTPRPSLLDAKTGNVIADAVQMAQLQPPAYDPRYDYGIVLSRAITSQMVFGRSYLLNVDFDSADGSTTIPSGIITLNTLMGEARS